MSIGTRVEGFLGALGQMRTAVADAGASIANTIGAAGGQIKNPFQNMVPMGQNAMLSAKEKTRAFLSGMSSSVPGSVQRAASQLGGAVPEFMEQHQIPGRQAVRQFQQTTGSLAGIDELTRSRAMGYGVGAAAMLGAGLAGAGINQMVRPKREEERIAGQHLGAQLGVPMPGQSGSGIVY